MIADQLTRQQRRQILRQDAKTTAARQQRLTEVDKHSHPQRYPKHDGDKGQVYGGECNRTACTNRRAVFWNLGTYGLYCKECADAIDYKRLRGGPRLCIFVNAKPKLGDMEYLRASYGYYRIEW